MLVLGALMYAGFALTRSADRVEGQEEVQQKSQALADVADPLLALCQADASVRARVGAACQVAADAVADPTVPTEGKPGADGATGAPGAQGVPGQQGASGAVGQPGATGVPGQPGVDGRDGVDGQPGADGRDGVDGVDGRNGIDGTSGQVGAAGPTGPAGRDGSPAQVITLAGAGPGGSDLTCARDGGDDTTPMYRCSAPSE